MDDCPPDSLGPWLASQHQRSPSEATACVAEVAALLDSLTQRLVSPLVAEARLESSSTQAGYVRRLWACLEFHWMRIAEQERVGFNALVERLEAGKLAYGQVQANVLEEVCLAQSLENGENKAAKIFEEKYMPLARGIASRAGGAAAVENIENLAAELILPRTDRPPRLATFRGRTPLASWLRIVILNDWVSRKRKRQPLTTDLPEVVAPHATESSLDQQECEQLLRPIFQSAVAAISQEDRLLLKMLILDGVSQQQLARCFAVHTGTIGRRRQQAAGAILNHVRSASALVSQPRLASDCMQLLLCEGSDQLKCHLSELLAEAVSVPAERQEP